MVEEGAKAQFSPAIGTLADYDRLVAEKVAPFHSLGPEVIAAIRAGLQFDTEERVVRSYDYEVIRDHLTQEQYRALLDLFSDDTEYEQPCEPHGYEPFESSPLVTNRPLIASMEDFDRTVLHGQTVLGQLSPEAIRRLRASLVITENGIGGLRYFEAENELSSEDFERFVDLFVMRERIAEPVEDGLSQAALDLGAADRRPPEPTTIKDYECKHRATCSRSLHDWCYIPGCSSQ